MVNFICYKIFLKLTIINKASTIIICIDTAQISQYILKKKKLLMKLNTEFFNFLIV